MNPNTSDIRGFGLRIMRAAALGLVGVMLADPVFGSAALAGEVSNERHVQLAPRRCDLVAGTRADQRISSIHGLGGLDVQEGRSKVPGRIVCRR
jgi:hypothetical protein